MVTCTGGQSLCPIGIELVAYWSLTPKIYASQLLFFILKLKLYIVLCRPQKTMQYKGGSGGTWNLVGPSRLVHNSLGGTMVYIHIFVYIHLYICHICMCISHFKTVLDVSRCSPDYTNAITYCFHRGEKNDR